MPERIVLSPREVLALVERLPAEVITRLASGPAEGDDFTACGVCAALRGVATAPIYDTPANRLQTWHEELALHDSGRGWRQDPVRCGVIYGAAAALAAGETGDGREVFLSALRPIAGPDDRGPWMDAYRRAGGGYEGLQAVARAALDVLGDDSTTCGYCRGSRQVHYHGSGGYARLRACPMCDDGRELAQTLVPSVREIPSKETPGEVRDDGR
jgi:hypothetical protein